MKTINLFGHILGTIYFFGTLVACQNDQNSDSILPIEEPQDVGLNSQKSALNQGSPITFDFSKDTSKMGILGEIHWKDEAKPMIEQYLKNDRAFKVRFKEREVVVVKTLEYVRVDTGDLKKLINSKPDEVLLMFAVSASTVDSVPEVQNFTMILAGAKKGTDGKLTIQTSPVFNKFSPCPDRCLKYADNIDLPNGHLATNRAIDCNIEDNKIYCKP